jgi:hypothetical protein
MVFMSSDPGRTPALVRVSVLVVFFVCFAMLLASPNAQNRQCGGKPAFVEHFPGDPPERPMNPALKAHSAAFW